MKRKSRKASLKRKHEFRFHDVQTIRVDGKKILKRHPAFIFLEKGNIWIFVPITHSKYVRGKKVKQLKKNPDFNDSSKSYWVAEINQDTKDRFGRIQIDWRIDPDDEKEIREFFEKKKR